MLYSERQLDDLANRIGDDAEELETAGFYLQGGDGDGDTGTAHVGLITARTDAAAYFRNRYGPVTVEIYATELTSLQCVDAGDYEISSTGRSLVLRWATGHGTTVERVDVVEYDDRVELAIVERAPNAPSRRRGAVRGIGSRSRGPSPTARSSTWPKGGGSSSGARAPASRRARRSSR